MAIWFDARDQRAETWTGEDRPDRCGTDVRSVLERAHRATFPYEFERDRTYGPDVVEAEFDDRDFRRARVYFHGGVEANRRVKLLVEGHLWGEDETHLRFRAQYRRESSPTTTVPFDEYLVWSRYCRGTVRHDEAGTIDFDRDDDGVEEETTRRQWDALKTPVRSFLAELELVRNPPFARHVLRERGEWEEVADSLRWDPGALGVAP